MRALLRNAHQARVPIPNDLFHEQESLKDTFLMLNQGITNLPEPASVVDSDDCVFTHAKSSESDEVIENDISAIATRENVTISLAESPRLSPDDQAHNATLDLEIQQEVQDDLMEFSPPLPKKRNAESIQASALAEKTPDLPGVATQSATLKEQPQQTQPERPDDCLSIKSWTETNTVDMPVIWAATEPENHWMDALREEKEFKLLKSVLLENDRSDKYQGHGTGVFPSDYHFSDSSHLLYWRMLDFTSVDLTNPAWSSRSLEKALNSQKGKEKLLNFEQEVLIAQEDLRSSDAHSSTVIGTMDERVLKINVSNPTLAELRRVHAWLKDAIFSIEELSRFGENFIADYKQKVDNSIAEAYLRDNALGQPHRLACIENLRQNNRSSRKLPQDARSHAESF